VINQTPISGDVIAKYPTCAEFIHHLDPGHVIVLVNLYSCISYIQAHHALPPRVTLDEWLTTTQYSAEGPKFKLNNVTEIMIPHLKGND